jgi:hypothetical protein
MILEINDEELAMLLNERYLKPNTVSDATLDADSSVGNLDTFLIDIVNANGDKIELCVAYKRPTLDSTQAQIAKQEVLLGTQITQQVQQVVQQATLFANIEDWIDDWRAAWSGKRLKAIGDRANCVKNMTEFLKIYPMYTKDIVFKARDRYLSEFNGDYSYMEQADYFIRKQVYVDGERQIRRTLLQYCESVEMTQKILEQSSLTTINPYDDI